MTSQSFGRISPKVLVLLVAMLLLAMFSLHEVVGAAEEGGRLLAEAATTARDRLRDQALGAARSAVAAQHQLRLELRERVIEVPRELESQERELRVRRLQGWLEFRVQLLASWLRGRQPVWVR